MHIYVQLTAALVSTGKRVQRVRRKMLFAIGIYKAMQDMYMTCIKCLLNFC